MCGIFGFALKKTVPMSKVFRVLEKLEAHRYPEEPTPVGGYGAGVAVLMNDGTVLLEKIGKTDGSPAKTLAEIFRRKVANSSVLVGHVRRPSPEFMSTAQNRVTAQPYVVQRDLSVSVVGVHNGKVENYLALRRGLSEAHILESEKIQLIDSEIVPHLFEENLHKKENADEALYELLSNLKGSNTACLLQVEEENTLMHFIHKGKTRGLVIWTNDDNEVFFCSREEPVMEEFGKTLARRGLHKKIYIEYREEAALKLSFSLEL